MKTDSAAVLPKLSLAAFDYVAMCIYEVGRRETHLPFTFIKWHRVAGARLHRAGELRNLRYVLAMRIGSGYASGI